MCVCVHDKWLWVTAEAITGYQVPCDWNSKWLWASLCGCWELNSVLFARIGRVFSPWTISPTPPTLYSNGSFYWEDWGSCKGSSLKAVSHICLGITLKTFLKHCQILWDRGEAAHAATDQLSPQNWVSSERGRYQFYIL